MMSAGAGCPETYEDCSRNAECGGDGSRVCTYACCRGEAFCVDLNDYEPGQRYESCFEKVVVIVVQKGGTES